MTAVKLTPLKRRIVAALEGAPGGRMSYYTLADTLWPSEKFPKAWRCRAEGGPPAIAMPLGKALRELRQMGIAYEKKPRNTAGHGDVILLKGSE